MQKKILISACLLGKQCRYNGKDSLSQQLQDMDVEWIPVCPEEEGGLGTPRKPAELLGSAQDIVEGNSAVITNTGEYVSRKFISGAKGCVDIGLKAGVTFAVLKSKSPSCGTEKVYDGSFKNRLIDGEGIFSYLCRQNGILTLSSEKFLKGISTKNMEKVTD